MSKQLPVTWQLGLTFAQLREANVKRCNESFHPVENWTPAEWLMCVTGELGELAHNMKRRRRGEPVGKHEIEDELADVAIYLDLLAEVLDVDLGAAIERKFDETSDKIGSDVYIGNPDDTTGVVGKLIAEDYEAIAKRALPNWDTLKDRIAYDHGNTPRERPFPSQLKPIPKTLLTDISGMDDDGNLPTSTPGLRRTEDDGK